VGNYAIFAGGFDGNSYSRAVDIFDASTGEWLPPTTLSDARHGITVETVGNYAIFAGGLDNNGFSSAADIFNAITGQWLPPATLSQTCWEFSAATVGNYAVFAVGSGAWDITNAVDIFNASTGSWLPPTTLSQPRTGIATATVGNYAIFAGGYDANYHSSNAVDIFNASTGSWLPPTTLSQPRWSITAATVGNYAIFAGGGGDGFSSAVDIFKASTVQWLTAPAVILSAPSNASNGTASIGYTLIDQDSNPCNIEVQYSVNGGPWQAATEATGAPGDDGSTGLASSPTGVPYMFVWDTATDLGNNTDNPSVQVRIIPEDSTELTFGESEASGSFAVNNSGVVNALVIDESGDSNNDAVRLVQKGSTISFSGTLAGATSTNMTGTAMNMTSVTVLGGSGSNTLDASQTIMPVTLDGGAGNNADTLLGGAGSDVFDFSGTGSTYEGGGSADNTIVYAAKPGDVITVTGTNLTDNGTVESLGSVSNIENIFVAGMPASVNNSQQLLWPIDDFPLVSAAINGITAALGSPVEVLTASFADTNPTASLSNESATINWGDGSTTTGTVASSGEGNFTVAGSHVYAKYYPTNLSPVVYVTFVDSLGTATVVGTDFSGGLKVDGQGDLLNFTDGNPSTIDTGVESYLVDAQDPTTTVFTQHTNGSLWAIVGSNAPQQIDSGVHSMELGPDGTLYSLHQNGGLYSIAPGTTFGLTFVAGSVQSVAEDSSGDLYRLDEDGSLSDLQPGASWTLVQQDVLSVASDPNNAALVDVLDDNGDLYTFDGMTWTFVTGPQITVGPSTSATAGAAFSVTVSVTTMVNGTAVPDTGYTGTVQFAATGSVAALPAYYTFTAADAGTHTFNHAFTLDTAGNQTITATDTATGVTGQASETVTPASPALISAAIVPQTEGQSTLQEGTQVGTATPFSIAVLDAFGNVVTSDDHTLTLQSSDSSSTQPSSVQLSGGVGAVDVTFQTAGDQTLTTTDGGNSLTGASSPVTVSPGPATQLVVTAPTSVLLDQSFTVTVTAEDQYGNVTGVPGALAVGGTQAFSGIGNSYPSTSLAGGVLTIPGVTANSAGNQTLTFTDSADSLPAQSLTINVSEQKLTALSAVAGTGSYGATATLTATLMQGTTPLAVKPVGFTLTVNGTTTNVGTATTNANGVATLSGVSLTGLGAGTLSGAIGVRFAGDTNDASTIASGNLTINAASATLAFGNLSFTYNGSAQGATVTTSPAGLSGVTISYSQNGVPVAAPTAAGTYSVIAALDNPNYSAPSITGSMTINQVTPTIHWASPANIVSGTALSGTQLDATSSWTVGGVNESVAGIFTYTPTAGTVLGVGNSQALSVIFTPTDGTDFATIIASVNINVTAPVVTAATFLEQDTTKEGNWINTYGTQGYEVIGNATSLPSYATVTPSGQNTYTYTISTTDPRALQDAGGSGRIAAVWYSFTSFTVDVDFSDDNTHDLELYFLDWDSTTRSEKVQISNASTGAVLDTETVSSFHSGVYENWQVSGNVLIKITKLTGVNAVLSGLFVDPTTSATFLKQDTTTEGSWINTYGTQGYEVIGNATSLPSYAAVTPSGQASWTWAASTTDPRALQDAGGTGRIAATWYSFTSFTVDVDFSDGQTHDLELYFLDWDGTTRSEKVQISNASTGTVLDTETISSFHSGVYDNWQVSGNVVIKITRVAGANAVLSGLFIDPTTSVTFLTQDNRTEGSWINTYGTQGYEVIGNATCLPSYATVTPSGQASWTWAASTTDPRALQQAGGTGRIAATWYSFTSFTVDVDFTDGQTHDLELYFVDWDGNTRSQKVQISNAATGAVLDTETVSSFHSGVYDNWQVSGNVLITITKLTGANAVLSGLFIDPTTSATFLTQDNRTEGSWINTYGTQGYEVVGNATSLPSYATVTPGGQASWTWAGSTTDARALQQASGSGRIAAAWYSATNFTVDVDFTDGQTHDLELYFLDWDGTTRSEKVQVSSASTGYVLDTETVSSFHSGVYDNWQVSGNVVIKITRLTGANAVLSGLFIDAGINESPGLAIGGPVRADGGTTSIPGYGTSDLSTPNPAGGRGTVPANLPRIVSPVAGGTAIDLALESLPADDDVPSLTAEMSTHDLALEQVLDDAWGWRMSHRWGTGGKSPHSGR
jgi:hypothetical protein